MLATLDRYLSDSYREREREKHTRTQDAGSFPTFRYENDNDKKDAGKIIILLIIQFFFSF